jgi:hypothetical protein
LSEQTPREYTPSGRRRLWNARKTALAGVLAGAVAAAVAYGVTTTVQGDTPDAGAEISAPATTVDPVIFTVPFEGDGDIAVAALVEQQNASRTVASELGVVLEPANPSGILAVTAVDRLGPPAQREAAGSGSGSGSDQVDPPSAPAVGPDAGSDDPAADDPAGPSVTVPPVDILVFPPSDADSTPDDPVIDSCVDGGESCPDGISGTILAIRALPTFAGVTEFRPAPPGAGFATWSPVCPGRDPEEGVADFGIATNRPATITFEYRTREWRESEGAIPWTTVEITTPAEAETAWNSWVADDDAAADDPRVWIQHCFRLDDLPPRGDYQARVTYADKYGTDTARNFRRLIPFFVPTERGLEPGTQRRPTTVLPNGLTELVIGVTRTPDQEVVVTARPGRDPATCTIAGDERSLFTGDGTVRGRLVSDTAIDPSTLEDPAYPYLRDHSRSVVAALDLNEGTEYVSCIYWLTDGPAFDPQRVELAESIVVASPEAYRPTVVLRSVRDLAPDVDQVIVQVADCGIQSYDLTDPGTTATDRTGSLQTIGPALELCTFADGLTTIDRRGIRVDTTAVTSDGRSHRGGAYIRTTVSCRSSECRRRPSELAMVPLPDVPGDSGGCGSGFGTGCLSDGTRIAGQAIFELTFDGSPGSGLTRWRIGSPTPFADAPPPLADQPQVATTTTIEIIDGDPTSGARAEVTATADRPVTFAVTAIAATAREADCPLGPVELYRSTSLSATHTFSLQPLCIGTVYDLTVEAVAGDGRAAEVVGERPLTPLDQFEVWVPSLEVRTDISVTVTAPDDDRSHSVRIRPVETRHHDSFGFGTNTRTLGWTWPAEDRRQAQSAGWQLFGVAGQANACGSAGARPLEVFARTTSTGTPISGFTFIDQDGIDIALVVDILENRPVGGGVLRDCVPGDTVESVRLQARVGLADLLAGITLTSDSGAVEFTLRAIPSPTLARS